MGWLCDQITGPVIADFVCPTEETRKAFNADFTIWVDRIQEGRYPDTNALFEPPRYDLRLREGSPEDWADQLFNPQKPTALFVGRFQPFHDGHKALIEEGIRRAGQAAVAVRNTPRSPSDPYTYTEVKSHILKSLPGVWVMQVPNVTGIYYGRDVGYEVEQIRLDAGIEAISATELRAA